MNEAGWAARHRRLILSVGLGIIVTWYAILLGSYLVIPALKDAIRTRTVEILQRQFGSNVGFQTFEVSFKPRVHVIASGILIGTEANPLLQAATAEAQSEILPWHIRKLVLEGLSVRIPTSKIFSGDRAGSLRTLTIADIAADHAHVEILPSDGQPAPLDFELKDLRVRNFSSTGAAAFSGTLENSAVPSGIQTRGHVGPWNVLDPSLTPLDGMYTIPRYDLAHVRGLNGSVSSEGRFRGNLQRIEIAGTAVARDFSLSSLGQAEPWHGTFQAALDAWDGSVSIEQIQGFLKSSSIVATGFVRNVQDDRRRDIALDVSLTDGRMEDVLPLAVTAGTSPIGGALRLRARLEIPPGDDDILQRLRLNADFTSVQPRFSSVELLRHLQAIGRRTAKRHARTNSGNVSSGSGSGIVLALMEGHMHLSNGMAEFSGIRFNLPGASGRLQGSYELASARLDLRGELSIKDRPSRGSRGSRGTVLRNSVHASHSRHTPHAVPIKISATPVHNLASSVNSQLVLDLAPGNADGSGSRPAAVVFSH